MSADGRDADAERVPPPPPDDVVERVLDVVRQLARETGGARAERAVSATASLEREIGLGSLERVELVARLERAFARPLDDGCLAVDTAAGLARAILEAAPGEPLRLPAREQALGAASCHRRGRRDALRIARGGAPSSIPERAHVFLRGEDKAAAEQAISYGRLRDEAAAVAGGPARARHRARATPSRSCSPPGSTSCAPSSASCWCAPCRCRSTPRSGSTGSRSTRAASPAILADAGVALLVTIARARPVVSLLKPSVPTLRDVVTADELAAVGATVTGPDGDASDPAFVQYTSGSTGQPKGVLLTHANLLANIRAIAAGLELEPTDVGVSWLPLYHDMGLIGSWLNCLHNGLPLTLMPPTAFLARPERWLWAIHERRATLSAAPNFAYELAARRIADERLEGLDLSSWRVALNGAEPVSPGTLERFARRFAPHGFRPTAMTPVYGLAECSVALAFPPIGRGPRVDRIAREPFQREGARACGGAGRPRRARVRLGRPRAARARDPHRRRRRRRPRRASRRPPRLPRALDDERLLPQSRGDRRDHAAGGLARQRRPGLPRGRRDPRLRTAQGPDHQGRTQPGAAGDRGGGGRRSRACAAAASWPSAS